MVFLFPVELYFPKFYELWNSFGFKNSGGTPRLKVTECNIMQACHAKMRDLRYLNIAYFDSGYPCIRLPQKLFTPSLQIHTLVTNLYQPYVTVYEQSSWPCIAVVYL
jgi:hypothetical protein